MYVKEALKKSGLGYFDDMQLRYGYHHTEELKKDRSFIRAFDRLKKEGFVKHLCLSQHSYDGSPRVKNGQSAADSRKTRKSSYSPGLSCYYSGDYSLSAKNRWNISEQVMLTCKSRP